MAQEENSQETTEERPFLRRGEDFESLYANHVYLVPTEWDIKMLFGEVDNDEKGATFVEQHTAISIPWLQAKLMHYFLTLQLGYYEMNHGKIQIPIAVQPPEAEPPTGELADNEYSQRLYELIRSKRAELMAP